MQALRSFMMFGFAGLVVLACSSGTTGAAADVSGNYSVSVTNETNGCNYSGWTLGQTAQNVGFDVTQSAAQANGNVTGYADVWFVALGIGTFTGSVNGSEATLSSTGTTSIKQGNCAYFVKASVDFTLTGNAVNGTMTYSNVTNGSPDCGMLSTCTATQAIAGSRPPK